MFDIGFGELLIIGLIGLLVLGPERLPGVARTVGGFVRKARRSWQQMQAELTKEVDRSRIQQVKDEMEQTRQQLRDNLQSADQSMQQTSEQLKQTVEMVENNDQDKS